MVSGLVAAFNRGFRGIKSNLNCGSNNSLMSGFLSQWDDEGNCIVRELAALTKVNMPMLGHQNGSKRLNSLQHLINFNIPCYKKNSPIFFYFLCYILLVQRIQEVFVMEQFSLSFIIPFNNKALMM